MKQVYPKHFKLNNLVRAAMGLPFVPIERIENGEAIHVLEDLANEIEEFLFFYNHLRSDDSNDVPGKKKITRNYKCPTCDKSYTQSHNLKKHRQREHGL